MEAEQAFDAKHPVAAKTRAFDHAPGQFVSVEGIRLHYVARGAGAPVVLLHGNAGSVDDFAPLLDVLGAQDFRAFAFDRPGHGLSERPPHPHATIETQARLMRGAVRTIGVEGQVLLVGHSWGAALALAYALQFTGEVAALLLLAPAAYPDAENFALWERAIVARSGRGTSLLLRLLRPFAAHVIRRDLRRAFAPDPVPADYLRAALAAWTRPSQLRAIVQDDAGFNEGVRSLVSRYPTLNAPTLILTGDGDQLVDHARHARQLRFTLPQAHLIELADTGHMLPQTRPAEVCRALRSLQRSVRVGDDALSG